MRVRIFSVCVVVEINDELVKQAGWKKVSSIDKLDELIDNDVSLYVSNAYFPNAGTAENEYYFWENVIIPDCTYEGQNNRSGIKRTNKMTYPDVSNGAARYYFENVGNKYRISCYDIEGKKYLKNIGNQNFFSSNKNDCTSFDINVVRR